MLHPFLAASLRRVYGDMLKKMNAYGNNTDASLDDAHYVAYDAARAEYNRLNDVCKDCIGV